MPKKGKEIHRERGFSQWRFTFRYRCRRCNAIFNGGGGDIEKEVLKTLRTVLQLGSPAPVIHENCSNGSRPGKGVGDLIGYDDYGPPFKGS